MHDLISRQAAIEALDDNITLTGWGNSVAVRDYILRAKKRLQAIPAAQPERTGKWIPCSERLPEDDVEVLIYFCDSPYIAWIEDTRWYTEEFEVERENEPKAWMALPEYNKHIDDYFYSDFCPMCGARMEDNE